MKRITVRLAKNLTLVREKMQTLLVGTQIVSTALGAVPGGTAPALGQTFGLGGKEKAKAITRAELM